MRGTTCSHERKPEAEGGSVLVLAMLVTLVILGVGMTAIYLSSSGMKISGNISRRQEALGAAETGLDRAQMLFADKGDQDWDKYLKADACGGSPFVNGKGRLLCDDTGTPVLLKDIQVVTNVPDDLPASYGNFLRYTVYIRNDQNETLARGNDDDEDKRIVVRAEGIGRDGISYFAIEAGIISTSPSAGALGYTGQSGGGPSGGNSFTGTTIPSPP